MALAADVRGVVSNPQGHSVAGLQVVAKTTGGQVAGQATTGADGGYNIPGLSSGNYNFTLEPGGSGLQGQTVASYVGPDGLCLNWGTSATAPAVATAQPGSTCQPIAAAGWGTAETVGAGAVLIGGGAIGAAAAFSGSDHHGPTTPAQ
jgi:Carboxypeptidase regulatory-like domain